MRRISATTVSIGAFAIGASAPFALSILMMHVSFDDGARIATIMAPAILMADRWPDPAIPIVNGLLYSCLAWGIRFLLPLRRR